MKYLLKHKNNNNYKNPYELNFLDCPVTLLNHFEQRKNDLNTYVIDLTHYDEMDVIIIKSIIKQIYEINPNNEIYIIGENNFNYLNVRTVKSIVDVPI
jgi:hypothetical protein